MDLNLEEIMWEQGTVKTEVIFHLCTELEVSIAAGTATTDETWSENPGA